MDRIKRAARGEPMLPTGAIGRLIFARALTMRGAGLNIGRLLTSRHLVDLQWIATLSMLAFVGIIALSVHHGLGWFQENSAVLTTALGAALALANWSYQSGNRRLGTIDLFASEISTICRVWLVLDFARRAVDSARNRPETVVRFESDDDYTPVHDSQLADLVPFDVSVVTTVTEYYTYRMTMIDYLRNRAVATNPAVIRDFTEQMLYMLYLALEAGRNAISEIVEFEPNEAESVINILCSEIPVFAYLLQIFPLDDYRGKRLRLRFAAYAPIIEDLGRRIREDHLQWSKASTTFPELVLRYEAYRQGYPDAPSLRLPHHPG